MSKAEVAAIKQHRKQMRDYWMTTGCTIAELAQQFDVSQDVAHQQILKAKKERQR